MLSSIHPLGERSRNNRWPLTVSAYVAGSLSAGALIGVVLGLAGRGADVRSWAGSGWTAALVAGLAVVALVADATTHGLPGVRRQVNEDWLSRYRGWVYGVGFGFQLGLGVATIVTTASVYLALGLAFLSGSALGGAAVGATYGLARGMVLLSMAGVRGPDELRGAHRRLQRWNRAWLRVTLVGEAMVAAGALATVVR
jgi:hypothetical protein